MATAQERAQAIWWYAETNSVIQVQRNFRRVFQKDPPSRNTIKTWTVNITYGIMDLQLEFLMISERLCVRKGSILTRAVKEKYFTVADSTVVRATVPQTGRSQSPLGLLSNSVPSLSNRHSDVVFAVNVALLEAFRTLVVRYAADAILTSVMTCIVFLVVWKRRRDCLNSTRVVCLVSGFRLDMLQLLHRREIRTHDQRPARQQVARESTRAPRSTGGRRAAERGGCDTLFRGREGKVKQLVTEEKGPEKSGYPLSSRHLSTDRELSRNYGLVINTTRK
ncbi:hypothetical protein ANN_15749 [Periplaneta americana]|uniref:DUF4817 domain-containing protein n=1 Tax=Periplaneta americana TaxID=6978 RepID=A0ABQ8SIC0_PERAM|nr:hypothetical protein ANN_15749 [Periplaneta americana]